MPNPQARGKRCGAKTRRGTKCQQPAMPNGRCRMHGGPTPSGIASPHFKHGARSRVLQHLPAAWAIHFDPTNPNISALTDELGVLDAAITDVYQRMKGSRTITSALKKELADHYDRKARLLAVDSRRRKDEHEMVSRDKFGEFTRAFLTAINMHVEDRDIKAKIQADAMRILMISQGPFLDVPERVG